MTPPMTDSFLESGQLDLLQDFKTPSDPVCAIETPSSAEPSSEGPPSRLLIVDTETTGLDADRDQCLELGAILFSIPHRQVLAQMSCLLPVDRNPAEAINRIPAEVSRLDQPWGDGLAWFERMMASADYLVAHNAAFDRQWFGCGSLPEATRPWLCTLEDVRWPEARNLRARPSVIDLALAYGIPVWSAHRALTDCIYLAEVFQRCDDLERLIAHALEPRRLVRAQVSYDQRHLARDAGFRWNDPIKGAWARRLSEREERELPFRVVPVEAALPQAS